jgi:hypothetical protein
MWGRWSAKILTALNLGSHTGSANATQTLRLCDFSFLLILGYCVAKGLIHICKAVTDLRGKNRINLWDVQCSLQEVTAVLPSGQFKPLEEFLQELIFLETQCYVHWYLLWLIAQLRSLTILRLLLSSCTIWTVSWDDFGWGLDSEPLEVARSLLHPYLVRYERNCLLHMLM